MIGYIFMPQYIWKNDVIMIIYLLMMYLSRDSDF